MAHFVDNNAPKQDDDIVHLFKKVIVGTLILTPLVYGLQALDKRMFKDETLPTPRGVELKIQANATRFDSSYYLLDFKDSTPRKFISIPTKENN